MFWVTNEPNSYSFGYNLPDYLSSFILEWILLMAFTPLSCREPKRRDKSGWWNCSPNPFQISIMFGGSNSVAWSSSTQQGALFVKNEIFKLLLPSEKSKPQFWKLFQQHTERQSLHKATHITKYCSLVRCMSFCFFAFSDCSIQFRCTITSGAGIGLSIHQLEPFESLYFSISTLSINFAQWTLSISKGSLRKVHLFRNEVTMVICAKAVFLIFCRETLISFYSVLMRIQTMSLLSKTLNQFCVARWWQMTFNFCGSLFINSTVFSERITRVFRLQWVHCLLNRS